jgi:hypothetical protein
LHDIVQPVLIVAIAATAIAKKIDRIFESS